MNFRTIVLSLAILTAPLLGLAEGEGPIISDKKLKKMQAQLHLSEEQVAEMRRIRGEGGSRKDIRAVLTDEQKAQAKEIANERKKNMENESKDSTVDS